MKVVLEEICTTGDLAEALLTLPKSTSISPFGSENCKLVYDEKEHCAYIDEDCSFLEEEV